MIVKTLGVIAVATGLIAAFAFAPTVTGANARRAVAVKAVQLGAPAIGVAMLKPLAKAGDAAAQNNLAVLLNRGIGVARDPLEAARLFNAAAKAGLPRAQMNLTLIRTPCNTQYTAQTTAQLEAFARDGDRRAASFVADCLDWSVTSFPIAEAARRLLAAAEIATRNGDADEELKFGWTLMKRTKELEGWGVDEAIQRETAQAAALYLFRAAEHRRASAYEGIAKLEQQSLAKLGTGPLTDKVAAKQPAGWIDTAARAGHPKSRCEVGVRLATEMSATPAAASESNRKQFAEYFQSCMKNRNPRQVLFHDGQEHTLGHDPLFDIWMKEDPFLIFAPRYENYDYDIAGRDEALSTMVRLSQTRATPN